jgi:hypothetical protein
MSELLSIVSLVGFLVGQIQIVTLAIKGKKFSFTKNAFVIAYLLIGINIPLTGYFIILIKYQKNIPLLSLLFNFYVFGIILIGISLIIYDYYKILKKNLPDH